MRGLHAIHMAWCGGVRVIEARFGSGNSLELLLGGVSKSVSRYDCCLLARLFIGRNECSPVGS